MKIELSVSEYQKLREALLELPAKKVYELIAKLDMQVVEQMQKEGK